MCRRMRSPLFHHERVWCRVAKQAWLAQSHRAPAEKNKRGKCGSTRERAVPGHAEPTPPSLRQTQRNTTLACADHGRTAPRQQEKAPDEEERNHTKVLHEGSRGEGVNVLGKLSTCRLPHPGLSPMAVHPCTVPHHAPRGKCREEVLAKGFCSESSLAL
ncbi:unnamed protein product [Ixodes pacificus]